MASLEDPVTIIPRTASVTFKKLHTIGIETLLDLLNYVPRKYKDYSTIYPIEEAIEHVSPLAQNNQDVSFVTIKGVVTKTTPRYLKGGLTMQLVTITDQTGSIECVWFRQPFILTTIKIGATLLVSGALRRFGTKYQLSVDEFDLVVPNKLPIHSGRLVPIYSEKRGLSSKTVREKIALALNTLDLAIDDPLPLDLIEKQHLVSEEHAYRQIHFPDSVDTARSARERLAFDELFTMQLASNILKSELQKETVGHAFDVSALGKKVDAFIKSLPFTLTGSQLRIIREISNDLTKSTPMNRLVQGDVGSGKTVIAAVAAYITYLSGYTTLLMAPTEILAVQHYQTLSKLFTEKPTISLKTSSHKGADANIIVGTHSLVSKKAKFSNVGLVVIDEQHKFGVSQRATLKESGINPHLLTMTATPIPRSVGLTIYGELDLSILDELPPGRQEIKTYVVKSAKRDDSYSWMKAQIRDEGAQIFIVCPLIEESEHETMQTVKAVSVEFEKLKDIFKRQKLGLLHGKMKSQEKDNVMNDFKNRQIDILVSTPVVEVGVDIPNATIMVIEGAERFGLAQLHQLRGRVGRGKKQSHCLLFTSDAKDTTYERLNYFSQTSSGFKLAEYDLLHRGTGELYGTRQHGASDLVLASLGNTKLVEITTQSCEYFLKNYKLKKFVELDRRVTKLKKKKIAKD